VARIRTIKPEFFTSEQVVECSPTARLLFVGLWCFCDDYGIHPASPKRLKMEVFPGDSMTDEEVAALIDELIQSGLLRFYTVAEQDFWVVTGWRHQKIEKPTRRYPGPEEATEKIDDQSSNTQRPLDDSSRRKGREGKGRELIGARTRRKPFVRPTVEQIQAYCAERGNKIDAQYFWDKCESIGWVVGRNKTPMVDWKAVVRTWEKNQKNFNPTPIASPPTKRVPVVFKADGTFERGQA
jgi:hypothetical protein